MIQVSDSPLRVVVLGAGRMGGHHLAAASRGSSLMPVGLLERDPARHHDLTARTGLPVEDNLARLVEHVAPDCAIVATPDPTHVELADACLALGLHTLVEKPLDTSPARAAGLVERFGRSGLVLGSGLVERFNPAWNTLRELFADDCRATALRIIREGPSPRDPSSGPVFDLAVHDIDLLLQWPGAHPLRILDAQATPTHLSAHLSLGTASVHLSVAWRPGPAVRTWSVDAGLHTWEADLQSRTIRRMGRDGSEQDAPVPAMDALELEHAAFAAAIRGSVRDTFPGMRNHVRALELCQKLSYPGVL